MAADNASWRVSVFVHRDVHRSHSVGFMIATENGGHVRSFSITRPDFDGIHTRSNERYDALFDLLQLQKQLRSCLPVNQQRKAAITDKHTEKGILGECILRQLGHFDVGRSFMVDSLHNIYLGAFVSRTHAFFTVTVPSIVSETHDWTLAQYRISK